MSVRKIIKGFLETVERFKTLSRFEEGGGAVER